MVGSHGPQQGTADRALALGPRTILIIFGFYRYKFTIESIKDPNLGAPPEELYTGVLRESKKVEESL